MTYPFNKFFQLKFYIKSNVLPIIFFRIRENWISLSKSFQPEDKSPGVETLKLTSPISIAIVYKRQFCLHCCCAIILHPRDEEINTLHT